MFDVACSRQTHTIFNSDAICRGWPVTARTASSLPQAVGRELRCFRLSGVTLGLHFLSVYFFRYRLLPSGGAGFAMNFCNPQGYSFLLVCKPSSAPYPENVAKTIPQQMLPKLTTHTPPLFISVEQLPGMGLTETESTLSLQLMLSLSLSLSLCFSIPCLIRFMLAAPQWTTRYSFLLVCKPSSDPEWDSQRQNPFSPADALSLCFSIPCLIRFVLAAPQMDHPPFGQS